jgi:GNAT superfamily N-acetyltransferase
LAGGEDAAMSAAARIDPAHESDAGEILRLIRELAVYEKLEHAMLATEDDLRQTLFGEQATAHCYLLRENDAVAGMAIFFYNYSTFLGRPGLYLEDLFIRPQFRRKGYGKMMLSFLAKIALEKRCGRFEWAVLDWNQPAIDFYRTLGAEPLSDWTVFRVTEERIRSLAAL